VPEIWEKISLYPTLNIAALQPWATQAAKRMLKSRIHSEDDFKNGSAEQQRSKIGKRRNAVFVFEEIPRLLVQSLRQ